MKNLLLTTAFTAGLMATSSAVIIYQDDFEGGLNLGGNGVTTSIVAAPAGFTTASGNVLQVAVNDNGMGGVPNFAAVDGRGLAGNFAFPALGPGQSYGNFTLTYDVFIAEGTNPGETAPAPNAFVPTLRFNNNGDVNFVPGNTPTTVFNGSQGTTPGTVVSYNITGAVPAGDTNVFPLFGATQGAGPNTANGLTPGVIGFIDNVTLDIEVIPEPSSTLLLGLGGLALLRRRR